MLWTLLFLPLSTPCLVVRSTVTTTTPEPTCDCPYHLLDSTNIMEHINTIPIISNLTNYGVSKPIVKLDDCMTTLYCENDNSLVVFDAENYDYFGLYQADVICDKYTKKSMVFGESVATEYNELFATCTGPSTPKCPCAWTMLTPSNVDQLLANHEVNHQLRFEFWDEVTSYDLGPDHCPTNIVCPANWDVYLIYTDYFRQTGDSPLSVATCNAAEKRWEIFESVGQYLYPYCNDREKACQLSPIYFDMHSSYTEWLDKNEMWRTIVSKSKFDSANYTLEMEAKCVTEVSCPHDNQDLVVLGVTETLEVKRDRVSVGIDSNMWEFYLDTTVPVKMAPPITVICLDR